MKCVASCKVKSYQSPNMPIITVLMGPRVSPVIKNAILSSYSRFRAYVTTEFALNREFVSGHHARPVVVF